MAQAAPTRARVRSEPSPKWIHVEVANTVVASSRHARLVWQGKLPRTYAFPLSDVSTEHVVDEGEAREHEDYGRIREADLDVDGEERRRAVILFEEGDLEDHAAFHWGRVDAWFEEDEQVWVHPHDPHHRIDVLQSSRHVVVEVDGERLAESRRPVLLFETGLPVRYYLPRVDVDRTRFRESATRTACPYKGFARYYDVRAGDEWHEDLVWTYRTSFHEAIKVQGYLAFYNHRVDLTVDGERQER